MYEIFLALRYLKAKRRQAFISVISIISILGVMVGVMALIVVLSVMNGFRADLMSKILGVNSHLLILNYEGPFPDYRAIEDRVEEARGVVGTTPFIYGQVMVKSATGVSGAVLRGVDPATVGKVLGIRDMIHDGSLDVLEAQTDAQPTVILGRELARQLGAFPGDTVTVVSPEGRLTPLGRAPNSIVYRVGALFDSGMYEYDASMIYLGLKEARELMGLVGEKVTGIEVRLADMEASEEVAGRIQTELGYPFWAKDWKLMNRSLFSALKLEKITMFVILSMIVLVGALNIISTLVMVVMEKTRDIAILRAMGASARNILTIFMLQGVLVGVLGTLCGLLAGLGLCQTLSKYQFIHLPADVYYISTLPVKVVAADVWFVGGAAVLISFLATLYPSWHASRLDPVEGFRYYE